MNRTQKLATFYLVIMGILYAAFGLWCMANPLMLSYEFGYTLTLPQGFNEFRASYGGQFIMVGVFLYIGGNRLEWQRPALLLLALQLAGFAFARLFSMILDGMPGGLHLVAFCADTFCSLIAFVLLVQLGKNLEA